MRIRSLLTLLLSSFIAKGQHLPDFNTLPHNNPLNTPLDSLVHTYAAGFFSKADAPGVVLGIYQNGNVHYYCYGYADKAAKQVFTDSTLLEIGSITKTFTAIILLRLQQEGVLNIDQPLADFFPDAAAKDTSLYTISLRQLLNHSGGIPRLPANLDKAKDYSFLQPYENYTRAELEDYLKIMKPGTPGKYNYSNLGYGILGTIATIKSGKDFESLLKEYVFTPLNMQHSSSSAIGTLPQACGYMKGSPAAYWKFDCLAGAGTVKSTPADMITYLEACLGKTKDTNLHALIEAATVPTLQIADGSGIGMAWHIMTNKNPNVYWHNGGTYGFSTFAAFEPKSQTAIFAAANAFNVNGALETFSGKVFINITETK